MVDLETVTALLYGGGFLLYNTFIINNIYMDKTWQEEYKKIKKLSKRQIYLLDHGPDSLSSSWLVMAMKNDYEKITGKHNKNDD